MANYTTNLNLEKPLQSEQYNVDVFNANADKIDQFAGQVPARALTADTLTVARKINGVSFKGDNDIITGLGLHNATVTYNQSNLAYKVIDDEVVVKRCLNNNTVGDNFDNETYWEKVELGGGASRNIGEIVTSTIPLEDAGLHLLDGALLQYGSYQAFIDYIADLYDSGDYDDIFETEANWQASVTQYGVCGKFVYNSTNNTVRLPKYGNQIYTKDITNTVPVVGNGKAIAFAGNGEAWAMTPNSGQQINFGFNNTQPNAGASSTNQLASLGNNRWLGFSTDSNRSSLVADLANITTSLDGYYYIVVATTTKTNIQVDIDEIATDLNGKADVDLTNVNDTGYIKMAGASMPSDTYDDLTLGASGAIYTAPANGWFYISKHGSGAGQQLVMGVKDTNNLTIYDITCVTATSANAVSGILPVKKGDRVEITYQAGGELYGFRFIYAKGSESEGS